jgi:hypothetical protein
MPPSPLQVGRDDARQLDLFDTPADRTPAGGMRVPAFRGVAAWLVEIDRQSRLMRPRRPLYDRFDATAWFLTPERIRACCDRAAITRLVERLRDARHPWGHDLHGLNRVWTRVELGVLITEATNRDRLLSLGRLAPRAKGPTLDPARLPDDRLEHLIQTHRDLVVVETLRAERRRRQVAGGSG